MKIALISQEPLPKGIKNPHALSLYIASSLGLIPTRGKGDVVLELLLLLRKIASIKQGEFEGYEVRNGGIRAKDMIDYLGKRGVKISQSQFYTVYLQKLLDSGIVIKKKGSFYGLRAPTLELTLQEVFKDMKRVWDDVVDVARKLDDVLEE